MLRTQGHDYASRGQCPALGEEGRCTLHGADKPTACASVPLDAALPDRLQPIVLQRRAQAAAFGDAGCIATGPRDGHTPWIVDGQLTDGPHRADLEARRAALAAELPLWSDAVFERFGAALQRQPIAPGGFLALPLVPVLDVLPGRTEARAYAQAQRGLIAREVDAARARRNPADRATTKELRAFDAAYAGWLAAPPSIGA